MPQKAHSCFLASWKDRFLQVSRDKFRQNHCYFKIKWVIGTTLTVLFAILASTMTIYSIQTEVSEEHFAANFFLCVTAISWLRNSSKNFIDTRSYPIQFCTGSYVGTRRRVSKSCFAAWKISLAASLFFAFMVSLFNEQHFVKAKSKPKDRIGDYNCTFQTKKQRFK